MLLELLIVTQFNNRKAKIKTVKNLRASSKV